MCVLRGMVSEMAIARIVARAHRSIPSTDYASALPLTTG